MRLTGGLNFGCKCGTAPQLRAPVHKRGTADGQRGRALVAGARDRRCGNRGRTWPAPTGSRRRPAVRARASPPPRAGAHSSTPACRKCSSGTASTASRARFVWGGARHLSGRGTTRLPLRGVDRPALRLRVSRRLPGRPRRERPDESRFEVDVSPTVASGHRVLRAYEPPRASWSFFALRRTEREKSPRRDWRGDSLVVDQ
jgi:hypothetical protein